MASVLLTLKSATEAAIEPPRLFGDSDVKRRHFIIVCPALLFTCTWIICLSITLMYVVMLFWYWSFEVTDTLVTSRGM